MKGNKPIAKGWIVCDPCPHLRNRTNKMVHIKRKFIRLAYRKMVWVVKYGYLHSGKPENPLDVQSMTPDTWTILGRTLKAWKFPGEPLVFSPG